MPFEQAPNSSLEKLQTIRDQAALRVNEVAALGGWPSYIPPLSILERIPKDETTRAPGFDAGLACALDLIPRDKQELAAQLHANYSKEAVMRVREEHAAHDPNSATTWWLAACGVCDEGNVTAASFLQQIELFKQLAQDPQARLDAAEKQFEKMSSTFEIKYEVPYGEIDGCIQGAYVAGYPFGVHFSREYGLYFIGTYEPSLGLENFEWGTEVDEKGRAKSGPVFNSKQFVKCASEEELLRALAAMKENGMVGELSV